MNHAKSLETLIEMLKNEKVVEQLQALVVLPT